MQSLKILHVLPRLHTGGVETATAALACGLLERGHQVWVMSEGGAWVKPVEERGGVHIFYPAGRKAPWHWIRCARHIEQWVQREKIQLIHPHSRAPGWASWMAARSTRIPLVTSFHGIHGHHHAFKRGYNRVMTWGDRVIAPTHYVESHLKDIYDVPQKKIRVVYEGIDPHAFTPIKTLDTIQQWRALYGIPRESLCLSLPGRLTELKGHAIALQAVASLMHDDPKIVLCLMGAPDREHPYLRRLITMIQEYNLQEHIIWIAPDVPIQHVYTISDVVLVPSQVPEAFGRVVAEAQAMERMVIASHPGGASEVIEDGRTGWLFPRGDVQALVQRIREFLALSPAERQMGQQRARERMLKHFHVDRMVNQTWDVYREVLCPPSL